jgi:uncharacterized protein with GYD domain
MKTFVLMTRLAASDALLVEVSAGLRKRNRTGREWLDIIREKCPQVHFKAHYALMGHWDFMDIYEAPDEEIAAKVSLLTRNYGASEVESWLAIPYEKILKLSEEIDKECPEKNLTE